MPAVVKSTDGSVGISDDEEIMVCPFFSKKDKNNFRTSSDVMIKKLYQKLNAALRSISRKRRPEGAVAQEQTIM